MTTVKKLQEKFSELVNFNGFLIVCAKFRFRGMVFTLPVSLNEGQFVAYLIR